MPPITVFKIERILDAYFLKAMSSSIFISDKNLLICTYVADFIHLLQICIYYVNHVSNLCVSKKP